MITVRLRGLALGVCVSASIVPDARAESISGALARAYAANPTLNAQRAGTRSTDEGVSRSKSAFRPQVTFSTTYGPNYINANVLGESVKGRSFPSTGSLTISETIFNGNRNSNGVRHAVSQVFQSREQTRLVEQNTLQNGATTYMNVLRDTAILELDKNNILVLEAQLRQTSNRYKLGEVTRTDQAQADTSLASARSTYAAARSNLRTSIANYRQIIGVEPHDLTAARPLDNLLPSTLDQATAIALAEHPSIQAALHAVDAASLQVQVNEGALYPTVSVVGNVQNNTDLIGLPGSRVFNASVLGEVSVPIYTGGETYSSIRQAKEQLTQAQLQVDADRDMIRADLASTWGQLDAAKTVVRASQSAVRSASIALEGVREEAAVGQRTTLDILMAQQTLLQQRVNLVSAERDRVVATYAVLASIGHLSAGTLGLAVVSYDPTLHYEQVKDKWFGLRTPSGR